MKSIRTKIILLSCLICICSILSATIISYQIVSDNIKQQTFGKLEEISKKHAIEIEGWFSIQARILNELYDEIIYHNNFDKDYLIKYFNFKNQKNSDIKEYYIAFPDNVFVRGFGIWIPDGDYNVIEREWYKKAVESEEIAISSPYVDSNHGEVIVTLSRAIRINNEIVGVLCSDIAIEHIVNIINESIPLEQGYGFLVDNNKYILAHPNKEFLYSKDKGLISVNQIYNDGITVKHIGEKEFNSIVDYDGDEKFILYTKLGFTGWDIGLAASVKQVMKPLNRIVEGSITLTIILTIISVILTFLIGNSISKPIKEATNYIEQMAQLDITQDTSEEYLKMKDEIGRMFNAFQMIVKSLRGFLSDLTIISDKISTFSDELAVLSNKSSIDADNIAENLANVAEMNDGQRKKMSRLIESMEDLNDKANKLIVNDSIIKDELLTNQLKSIVQEIEKLTKDFNQTQDIGMFEATQIKNIYSLIDKQTLTMEEISSASQCLAELGEELNVYIAKFKS